MNRRTRINMPGRGRSKFRGDKIADPGEKIVDINLSKQKRKRSRSNNGGSVSKDTISKETCCQQSKVQIPMKQKKLSDKEDISGTRKKLVNQSLLVNRSKLVNFVPKFERTKTRYQTKKDKIVQSGKDDVGVNNNATLLGKEKLDKLLDKKQLKNPVKNKCVRNIFTGESEADQQIEQQHSSSFDGVEVDVNSSDEFEDEYENREVVESSESEQEQSQGGDDEQDGQDEIILGIPRSAREMDEERALNNPFLKNLLDKMLEEKLKQVGLTAGKTNTNVEPQPSCSSRLTEAERKAKGQSRMSIEGSKTANNFCKIKSPSDTTIYRPALNKRNEGKVGQLSFATQLQGLQVPMNTPTVHAMETGQVNNMVQMVQSPPQLNNIDDFVESIRKQHEETQVVSEVSVPGLDDARARTEHAVIEAEKFKATIADPPGKQFIANCVDSIALPVNRTIQDVGNGMSDDDFFHLTCFIEPSMFQKIERGEFVDLEKLLKDKNNTGDQNRLEWIQQDGATFLAPATKQNKITGVRKWEQAFRVYASIYCAANPHRSKEIWQYISIINTAAASYFWDNVSNYDITFRHLMAFNPSRSWAVTYNQMWNLSMKDPLPRGNAGRSSFGGSNNFGSNNYQKQNSSHHGNNYSNNNNSGGGHAGGRKPQYCWNFNKGIKCKYGKSCKFIERCSYCDSSSHGVNICSKVGNKDGGHHKRKSHGSSGGSNHAAASGSV